MRRLISVLSLLLALTGTASADWLTGYQGRNEVVKLTSCTNVKEEGRLCWDTDNDTLYIGTGTAAAASSFASTNIDTSAELAAILGDETGTAGKVVFDTTPTLVTPVLGAATGTSLALSGAIGQLGGSTGATLSAASGVVTMGGIGNTNNENVTINFETNSNRYTFDSTTSATAYWADNVVFSAASQMASNWNQNSNINFGFGSTNQGSLEFDTAETNDTIKICVAVNSATLGSGNLAIVEQADKDTNFSYALVTDPHLIVQSSDATTVTDNVQIWHDQTDGNISTGGGDLKLVPAGGDVNITGNVKPSGNYLAADGSTGYTGATCTAFENGICTAGV